MNKINYRKVQIILNIIVIICFLVYAYDKHNNRNTNKSKQEMTENQNHQDNKFVVALPEEKIDTFQRQAEEESKKYKALGLAMSKKTRDYSDKNNIRNTGVGTKFLQTLFSHGCLGGKIEDLTSFAVLWHFRLNKTSKEKLIALSEMIKSGKISEQGFNNISGNENSADLLKELDEVKMLDLSISKLSPENQNTFKNKIMREWIESNTEKVRQGEEVGKNAVIDYEELARGLNK